MAIGSTSMPVTVPPMSLVAARGTRDHQPAELAQMSREQLAESCVRLSSRRQMMEILYTELQNEKSKLQKHQLMLTDRIHRVESAVPSSGGEDPLSTSPALRKALSTEASSPVRRQISATPAGDVAAGAMGKDAAMGALPQSVAYGATAGTAPAPEAPSPPSSPVPVAAAVGVPASALRERLIPGGQLSAPEELLLKGGGLSSSGVACLTWFYNEQVLEQLADPQNPLKRLSFEVRQQSEGANGRLRSRNHICECRGLTDGEEVGEQSFEVEGCVPGKPYAFSVRARAEFEGRASAVYSAFSETVTLGAFSHLATQLNAELGSNYEGQSTTVQSTTVSTPRSSSMPGDAFVSGTPVLSNCPSVLASFTGIPPTEEEEEQRRLEQEEAVTQRVNEEVRMRVESEKLKLVEEARKLAHEEAQRLAMEASKAAEAAAAKMVIEGREQTRREQEAAQKQLEEEMRQHVESERKKFEAEKRAMEEKARLQYEREAAERKHEEERRAYEARAKEQALQLQLQEEIARRAEEEARRKNEEELRRRHEEEKERALEEARRIEEEARKRLELEAAQLQEQKRRFEEEELRRRAEMEAKRQAEEQLAIKRAAEEAARKKADEMARQRAEEEERRREEARRLALIEEARKKAEEEEKRIASEMRKRQEEEMRKRAAEEVRRQVEEAERMRRSFEEERARRLAEEELQKQKQAVEQMRQREEELQKMLREQEKRAEEEAAHRELEARQREELEKRQREEALQRVIEEEKQREVEAQTKRRLDEETSRVRKLQADLEDEQRRQQEAWRTTDEVRRKVEEDIDAKRGQESSPEDEAAIAVVKRRVDEMEAKVLLQRQALLAQRQGLGTAESRSTSQRHYPRPAAKRAPSAVPASEANSFTGNFAQYLKEKTADLAQPSGPSSQISPRNVVSERARQNIPPGRSEPQPRSRGELDQTQETKDGAPESPNTRRSSAGTGEGNDPMGKWMNKILNERAPRSPASEGPDLGAPRLHGVAQPGWGTPGDAHDQRRGYGFSGHRSTGLGTPSEVGSLAEEGYGAGPLASRAAQQPRRGTYSQSSERLPTQYEARPTIDEKPLTTTLPGSGVSHPQHARQQQAGAANGPGADGYGHTITKLPNRTPTPAMPGGFGMTRPQHALESTRQIPEGPVRPGLSRGEGPSGAHSPVSTVAPSSSLPGQPGMPRAHTFGAAAVGPFSSAPPGYAAAPAAAAHPTPLAVTAAPGSSILAAAQPAPAPAPVPVPAPTSVQPPPAQPGAPPGGPPRSMSFSAYANVKPPSHAPTPQGFSSHAPSQAPSATASARHSLQNTPTPHPASRRTSSPGRGSRPQSSRAQVHVPQQPQRQATPQIQAIPPPSQHLQAPAAAPQPLDLSQRMARANELQQKYLSGQQQQAPSSVQSAPGLFNMQAPNLLNWAKEAISNHGSFHEQHNAGPDPLGLGLNTLNNLPPPPRSAPASEHLPSVPEGTSSAMGSRGGHQGHYGSRPSGRPGGGPGSSCPSASSSFRERGPSRDQFPPGAAWSGGSGMGGAPGGGGMGGGGYSGGGGRGQFLLKVLTSDSKWENLTFSPGDNLQQTAGSFLQRTALKGAFQSGLVSKMQAMIQMGQAQTSVDIVDLI